MHTDTHKISKYVDIKCFIMQVLMNNHYRKINLFNS